MAEATRYAHQEEIDFFRREGYHIVGGFLSPDEAQDYGMKINRVFRLPQRVIEFKELRGKTLAMSDGVTKNKDFWPGQPSFAESQ